MRAAALPVLAAAMLLAAGCLGSAPASDPPRRTQSATPPAFTTPLPENVSAPEPSYLMYPFLGSLTLAAGATGVGYVSPTGTMDRHVFRFPVMEGATGLVVELRWDDAMTDLDLEFGTPDCDSNAGTGMCAFVDGGTIGAGDAPVRVAFTDPATLNTTGDWFLSVWGKDAVQTKFETAATVFYGMAPPDNFTAYAP